MASKIKLFLSFLFVITIISCNSNEKKTKTRYITIRSTSETDEESTINEEKVDVSKSKEITDNIDKPITINDFFNSGNKNASIADFIKLSIGYNIDYSNNGIVIKCKVENISKRKFTVITFDGLCYDKNKIQIGNQEKSISLKPKQTKEFEIYISRVAFSTYSVSVKVRDFAF